MAEAETIFTQTSLKNLETKCDICLQNNSVQEVGFELAVPVLLDNHQPWTKFTFLSHEVISLSDDIAVILTNDDFWQVLSENNSHYENMFSTDSDTVDAISEVEHSVRTVQTSELLSAFRRLLLASVVTICGLIALECIRVARLVYSFAMVLELTAPEELSVLLLICTDSRFYYLSIYLCNAERLMIVSKTQNKIYVNAQHALTKIKYVPYSYHHAMQPSTAAVPSLALATRVSTAVRELGICVMLLSRVSVLPAQLQMLIAEASAV